MIRLAIIGAAGRMGRRIAALAKESGRFEIVAALEAPGSGALGTDLGLLAGVGAMGVKISETLTETADAVIDFSLPESTVRWVTFCRERKLPMVIGTTGLTPPQEADIAGAAAVLPIVRSGNYSMGINLLCRLVAQAAKILGEEYDIEISETHHRFKADAPSGTAVMLARAACEARGKDYSRTAIFGRSGRQIRREGEIGIHALRLGDTVGEHAVHFGNLGETVTLSHSAHTRDTFVRGALRAVEWVVRQPPGLYTMHDVLGL